MVSFTGLLIITSLASAPVSDEPNAPPPPVPVLSCTDDDGCEHPARCIRGQCLIDPTDVDEIEVEGKRRTRGGIIAMAVGGGVAALGAVLFAVGPALRENEARSGLIRSGGVLMGSGGVTLIAGGISYAVGKRKLERAARYRRSPRLAPAASRHDVGLSLSGRF